MDGEARSSFMYRMGIDIGGTFTDLVLYDEHSKTMQVIKTATTSGNPLVGAQKGMRNLGIDLKSLSDFTHGTTIGTNAIVQKRGARVALITTQGMRDILEADAGVRGVLYDIRGRRAKPLVKRSWRYEVTERVLVSGEVAQTLDMEALGGVLRSIAKSDAEAVAVCFLHSYANNAHEKKAEELIRKTLPELFVSLSSDVSNYPREFERFSTTVLNSYIGPLMSPYIRTMHDRLEEGGYDRPFWMMSATGGAIGAEVARHSPVLTINSGPAAGVVASAHLAKLLGYTNAISCDVGGTSADISLIKSYQPAIVRDVAVSGYPNVSPQLDIVTIGSGGGTVAWVDDVGSFRLGPHSTGGTPGPACYGLGGTEATTTDAAVMMGWINPNRPLGGEVLLHPSLASSAVSRIANALKVGDEYEMAEAIIKLAVAKMVGGIKIVSTGRGHDVRDFVLVAFGGAGPMFATWIASELGVRKVVIPMGPGNFCAVGMLQCEVVHQYLRPIRVMTSETSMETLRALFTELEERGAAQLAEEGFHRENMRFEAKIAMRYAGQHFTMELPLTASVEDLERSFHEAHHEAYRFAFNEPVMITDLILNAYGTKPKAMLENRSGGSEEVPDHLPEKRPVWFEGGFEETPVYWRDHVRGGSSFEGPLILEEMGSTTVVQPGWRAGVDEMGNLILERKG
jgi:N-methylhydantoinase A